MATYSELAHLLAQADTKQINAANTALAKQLGSLADIMTPIQNQWADLREALSLWKTLSRDMPKLPSFAFPTTYIPPVRLNLPLGSPYEGMRLPAIPPRADNTKMLENKVQNLENELAQTQRELHVTRKIISERVSKIEDVFRNPDEDTENLLD